METIESLKNEIKKLKTQWLKAEKRLYNVIGLITNEQTVIFCDECDGVEWSDEITMCFYCDSYLCKDHVEICDFCEGKFCSKHLLRKCHGCY